MKILYVHTTPLNSKMANLLQIVQMANAFSDLGHDVTLLLPTPKGEIKRLNRNVTLRFYERVLQSRKYELFNIFRINKIAKEIGPDLCYTRTVWPMFSLLIHEHPFVFEAHDLTLHQGSKLLNWIFKKIILRSIRYQNFLLFVSISQNLLSNWKKSGLESAKTFVAHDGFDKNIFVEYDSIKEKSRWAFEPDKKVVTYTGSLYPDREIETILKLANHFRDVLFIIAGGPQSQRSVYESLSKEQGLQNIHFLGHIEHSEIPSLLAASDILLAIWSEKVPTIDYCSPLKLFEYMASGKTIVAHGFPTIKEVLDDNVTAYLATSSSYISLVEKLTIAIEEYPNVEMIMNVKKKAFDNYSWQKRAEGILIRLKQIAPKRLF